MGKFQSLYGKGDLRTKEQIISDYVDVLIKNKVLEEDKSNYYKTDPIGQAEILDLLFDKLYETETYRGVVISTLDAFYHFVRFVLNMQWNKLIKNLFLDVERNRYTAIMCSRGLGKSTFAYVLYPLFKMFLYRGTDFLIVSNIPKQCVINLRKTKDMIDTNELLLEKKEIEKGKDLKWTEREIEYNGGSIVTLTLGTTPRGQHVNYAFMDDILRDDTRYSNLEIENYLFGQLFPCVQRKKGRLVVLGTPLHIKDIFHLIMNEKEDFGGKLIGDGRVSAKGFYSKMYKVLDDDGKVLFPEIYTEKDLEIIRKTQGELKFQREYLLKCVDTSAIIFPSELTNKCRDDNYEWWYKAESNNSFIIGVDVATAGSASADYSAFVVLELVETETGIKKVIRHLINVKGVPISGERNKNLEIIDPGQVDIIESLAKKFNNALVVVEKNNVGVALIQELRKRNVNVEEFVTDKIKKEMMIRYLVSEFESKNIIIPKLTDPLREMIEQLNNFGVKVNKYGKETMEALSGHDDIVIALALANQASQNYSNVSEIFYGDDSNRKNPFLRKDDVFIFGG